MIDLPALAISVRQPWAWALLYGGKDIENRNAHAVKFMKERGPIALHASSGMTRREYEWAAAHMKTIGVDCPSAQFLPRGGIIGIIDITDIVKESSSPWWIGPRGLIVRNPRPVDFIPCQGQVGFFPWKPDTLATGPRPMARWMVDAQHAAPLEEALL
jgi:hypothetical protein